LPDREKIARARENVTYLVALKIASRPSCHKVIFGLHCALPPEKGISESRRCRTLMHIKFEQEGEDTEILIGVYRTEENAKTPI
jgi:hypothetical protein